MGCKNTALPARKNGFGGRATVVENTSHGSGKHFSRQ